MTLSKACSNKVRLRARLEKTIGVDELCAKGNKWRVIPAFHALLCLFVSASVEMSVSPDLAVGTSAGPEKQQR